MMKYVIMLVNLQRTSVLRALSYSQVHKYWDIDTILIFFGSIRRHNGFEMKQKWEAHIETVVIPTLFT